jgi:AcrR family transcriptional regulator
VTVDRRVQRSRAALLAAAVALVSERGTTAIPVTDLAAAADVSRQLVYLQFGDRDALLVAAAADLVTRELTDGARGNTLATARHFATHRPFYRAMLTGSCAGAMARTLNKLFAPANQRMLADRFAALDEPTRADLAAFLAGGAGSLINDWLVGGADPLSPEELAGRLYRLMSTLLGSRVP